MIHSQMTEALAEQKRHDLLHDNVGASRQARLHRKSLRNGPGWFKRVLGVFGA